MNEYRVLIDGEIYEVYANNESELDLELAEIFSEDNVDYEIIEEIQCQNL